MNRFFIFLMKFPSNKQHLRLSAQNDSSIIQTLRLFLIIGIRLSRAIFYYQFLLYDDSMWLRANSYNNKKMYHHIAFGISHTISNHLNFICINFNIDTDFVRCSLPPLFFLSLCVCARCCCWCCHYIFISFSHKFMQCHVPMIFIWNAYTIPKCIMLI